MATSANANTNTLAWITDPKHRDDFVANLNDQRKTGQLCDVMLKVGNSTLPTHACVLAASSPVFRQIIYHDRETTPRLSNAPQEIMLVMPADLTVSPADGVEAAADLLDYIYTGKITLKQDTLNLVVKLAEAFALKSLNSLISTYLATVAVTKPDDKAVKAGSNPKHALPVLFRKRKRREPKRVVTSSTCTKSDSIQKTGPRNINATIGGGGSDTRSETDMAIASVALTPSSVGELEEEGNPPAIGTKTSVSCKKTNYSYSCPHENCEFTSGSARDTLVHKKIHPLNSYQCAGCSFVTGRCSNMIVHMRLREHANNTCALCGEVSSDRAAFVVHLARHDDSLPFFCRVCDFRCRTRYHLADHEAHHAVENAFQMQPLESSGNQVEVVVADSNDAAITLDYQGETFVQSSVWA